MKLFFVFIQIIFVGQFVFAAKHELFKGEAFENGKLVYIENHDVMIDDAGNVLEAKTTYVDPSGKVLGVLNSDFRKSLSLPEHLYEDLRTNAKYGIRRAADKIILFNQDDGKPEETKELGSSEDKYRVQVGCQGFNYYLKGELDNLRKIKSLPVLFMVPGDLSTYKFVLNFVRENSDGNIEFTVKIENLFLRMFAPELEFHYDPKKLRITWYKGISNIKNSDGKTMNVTINYKY